MSPAARPAAGQGVRRLQLPAVIGHRGAAGLAPENTLAAIHAARRAGAGWVELDVRLSRDFECVVIHDANLLRTTGYRANVSRTALAQIRQLDAGSWFSPAFAGEAVPSLADTLTLVSRLALGANIELKSCGRRNPALVAAVLATLARRGADGAPPVLISSFSPALLKAVRRRDPLVPLGLLLRRRRRPDWRRIARALGCVSIHCAEQALTPATVRSIKAAGFAVVAYTVNDPARGRELWSWGVDSLISGSPQSVTAAAARSVTPGP